MNTLWARDVSTNHVSPLKRKTNTSR